MSLHERGPSVGNAMGLFLPTEVPLTTGACVVQQGNHTGIYRAPLLKFLFIYFVWERERVRKRA